MLGGTDESVGALTLPPPALRAMEWLPTRRRQQAGRRRWGSASDVATSEHMYDQL